MLLNAAPTTSPTAEPSESHSKPMPRSWKNSPRPNVSHIPFDKFMGPQAERARQILTKPVAWNEGRRELFPCEPTLLEWLIAHPQAVAGYWRELDMSITDVQREGEEYVCRETNGSTVRFSVVCDQPNIRIVHCTGETPAGILPVKLKAEMVIVHRFTFETFDQAGTYVAQQLDGYAAASGPTLKLAMKLAPEQSAEMVRTCVQEMKIFFSVMARLMQTRPHWAQEKLPAIASRLTEEEQSQLSSILEALPPTRVQVRVSRSPDALQSPR